MLKSNNIYKKLALTISVALFTLLIPDFSKAVSQTSSFSKPSDEVNDYILHDIKDDLTDIKDDVKQISNSMNSLEKSTTNDIATLRSNQDWLKTAVLGSIFWCLTLGIIILLPYLLKKSNGESKSGFSSAKR